MPATLSRRPAMPATGATAVGSLAVRFAMALALVLSTLVGISLATPSSASAAGIKPATRYTAAAIAIAPLYKGRPYRWGAVGPSSFDCSGYTKFVFNRAGKALPRTAAAQYRVTKKIARSQARPGDLVFLKGRGGIYHVGIYAGNGTYWHAPRPGKVVNKSKIYGNWVVGTL